MCIFGNANDRQLKKLRKIADKIELLAPHYASMTDDELRAMTPYFKERLKEGATLDELLPDAYAVVREASSTVPRTSPYSVSSPLVTKLMSVSLRTRIN